MGDHLKRRQSKKSVKQHRARSAVGWVTAGRDSRRCSPREPGQDGTRMGEPEEESSSTVLGRQWVTVGKRDSRRCSPQHRARSAVGSTHRMKRRQSVKQHRAQSAVGWVTAGNGIADDVVQQHQERSALGWVTAGRWRQPKNEGPAAPGSIVQ